MEHTSGTIGLKSILWDLTHYPHIGQLLYSGMGQYSRDTAGSMWYKRPIHWSKLGTLELSTVLVEMDSPLVCCCGKDGHQRRLWILIIVVCRRPDVPTAVSPDLLVFLEYFVHMHYAQDRSYCAHEFFLSPVFVNARRFLKVGITFIYLFIKEDAGCGQVLSCLSILVDKGWIMYPFAQLLTIHTGLSQWSCDAVFRHRS